MRFRPSRLGSAILGLALWSTPASADIILEGYHGVGIKVCYSFGDSAGHQPVAVVRTVGREYFYHPLVDGQCVDQGYKFNYVFLYWADKAELAKGLPDSLTDPKTLSWLKPIRCLSDGGYITSNFTQYPDSIPITSEAWTYTILGSETAVTRIEQYREKAIASLKNIDYAWGSASTAVGRKLVPSGFSLGSVRGSKVRLTIPDGVATLRVMTLSGRILRQMRVLPTGARLGEVDLGMTPPAGSFVELRQGSRSSVIAVARP